ncbi:hypothetical protein [Caulobacter sp. 17J65-9]|uniref:hypothetical protein n=1 Tax=Caulobacter sp. 17J65-9 TaxID=2709382 RepID=UPI0013C5438A|nr:hypothetical protein [Caulobacter sp. 17J65-9]NEX94223.1 hypothetical protein [Caulobacter sp. 17J65-9]
MKTLKLAAVAAALLLAPSVASAAPVLLQCQTHKSGAAETDPHRVDFFKFDAGEFRGWRPKGGSGAWGPNWCADGGVCEVDSTKVEVRFRDKDRFIMTWEIDRVNGTYSYESYVPTGGLWGSFSGTCKELDPETGEPIKPAS